MVGIRRYGYREPKGPISRKKWLKGQKTLSELKERKRAGRIKRCSKSGRREW
jgi:hypothetical protein